MHQHTREMFAAIPTFEVGAEQVRDMCGWQARKRYGNLEVGVHCDSLAKGKWLLVGTATEFGRVLMYPTILCSGCKRDVMYWASRWFYEYSSAYGDDFNLNRFGDMAYQYEVWHIVDDAELTNRHAVKRVPVYNPAISRSVAWDIFMKLLATDQDLRENGVTVNDRLRITDIMQGGFYDLYVCDRNTGITDFVYRYPYREKLMLDENIEFWKSDPFRWNTCMLYERKCTPDGELVPVIRPIDKPIKSDSIPF